MSHATLKLEAYNQVTVHFITTEKNTTYIQRPIERLTFINYNKVISTEISFFLILFNIKTRAEFYIRIYNL